MSFAFDIKGQIEAIIQAADTAQKEPGGPFGYRLRRIILANFWLYTLQVFEIPHGRLLLAGNNASGKSTVLTAALPLALEGSLRPERLDTFGGKHKHAEYYVLGDEASSTSFNHSKRTSYVALEFEWCLSKAEEVPLPDLAMSVPQGQKDKKRFLTIGISLYGNESAATRIQPMYFLVTDGSRLIEDINLTHVSRDAQAHVCTQQEFKENLRGHGMICETQEKYANEVSKCLFGFDDPSRFRKLIELLLVLRRPNPSDGLTVNTVQQYLTDALPAIPDHIAREAVETVGEIDNLQQQIEQLEQDYQAVSELHRAQQSLALSNARNAGYQYRNCQQFVERLDKQITQLHSERVELKDIQQKTITSYEGMRVEKERIAGRITAIEMTDGFRAAEQAVEAELRVKSTQEQVQKQQKIVKSAQLRLQQQEESAALYQKRFQGQVENVEQHMRTLSVLIETKTHWYDVAEQFQQALEHVSIIRMTRSDTTEIIQQASRLTKTDTEQRLKWLQELDALHQEKKDLERAIESAQIDENRCSRTVDALFTPFKDSLSSFFILSKQIEVILVNNITNTTATPDMTKSEDELVHLERLHDQETIISLENIDEVDTYLERCDALFQQHERSVQSILNLRAKKLADLEEKIKIFSTEKIHLQHQIATKGQEYRSKESQIEVTPTQPEHRKRARQKLAEQHIPAFPLYSLIDLAPTCEKEEAGYIESMLEDTGLLDALVILDQDIPLADKLLQTEELSDYRLDQGQLEQNLLTKNATVKMTQGEHWLCFDSATRDTLPSTTYEQWEAIINRYIPIIESLILLSLPITTGDAEAITHPTRNWQYGFLTGQSAREKVRFLGKATRQHARQQELALIALEITNLESKLVEQTQTLLQLEGDCTNLSQDQETIYNLLHKHKLPIKLDKLKQDGEALINSHKHLQEAQEKTYKKRQEHNHLIMKLVKQSGSIVVFMHEPEKVRIALHETYKLGPQINLLQQELESLQHLYEEVQEKQKAVQGADSEKSEYVGLLTLLQDQLVRSTSMLDTLQVLMKTPESMTLEQELATLRARTKTIDDTLLRTVSDLSTFTERSKTLSETIIQRGLELQNAQIDMRQKQTSFKDQLIVYPVSALEEAILLFEEGQYTKVVQPLQINNYTQERLQQELLQARSQLETTHKTHMNMLHEYGPELDQKTMLITFSQRNGITPVGLLSWLNDILKQQQELLKDQEIKLFESFLLRRMTEVLYKYIGEAKEWVNKMNEPLQKMSTVQDHYELEWQPKPRQDVTKLGSYLAKQQKLFSKPLSKLSEEEQELLKAAFKQEIDAIWHNDNEYESALNFEQRLQTIFDYRQWFQFRIYVTPKGGQRFLLNNKSLGMRSGAERLFDLLVPLLAAVTALYNHAMLGAPRLLALDEAFDRASTDNMKQFVEYLAGQDFQWIMTGPQLNISGTHVPVSIRYLMLHEKGSQVATAVPKIWKSSQVKNT